MPKKTEEQISYNMKRVKNKGSEIEILLQKNCGAEDCDTEKMLKELQGNRI